MRLDELPNFYPEPNMQLVVDPVGLDYTIEKINELAGTMNQDGDVYKALMHTLQYLSGIQFATRHIKYTQNTSVLLVSESGTNKANPFKDLS